MNRQDSGGLGGRASRGLALALLSVFWLVACSGQDKPRLAPHKSALKAPKSAELEVARLHVTVELAYTNESRQRGLMARTRLEPDHGMLFLFTDSQPRSFWMKNTLIALDIAFLDSQGAVINIVRGRPGVEIPRCQSTAPAQFVLEMKAGWCAEAGFGPGDVIDISPELRALAQPLLGAPGGVPP